MKFDFSKALQYVQLALVGVLMAQKVKADAPGATKKELAVESLTAATQLAKVALPGHEDQVDLGAEAAGHAIEAAVAIAKLSGHPDFVKPAQ